MTNGIERLQRWYTANCDGDWEHQYGLHLETLDNPGWSLKVDLVETNLANRSFAAITIQRQSEDDWINCSRNGEQFIGSSGPMNLDEMLHVFLDWAEQENEIACSENHHESG